MNRNRDPDLTGLSAEEVDLVTDPTWPYRTCHLDPPQLATILQCEGRNDLKSILPLYMALLRLDEHCHRLHDNIGYNKNMVADTSDSVQALINHWISVPDGSGLHLWWLDSAATIHRKLVIHRFRDHLSGLFSTFLISEVARMVDRSRYVQIYDRIVTGKFRKIYDNSQIYRSFQHKHPMFQAADYDWDYDINLTYAWLWTLKGTSLRQYWTRETNRYSEETIAQMSADLGIDPPS